MGNLCPKGSSCDVVKPPQSQDPGGVAQGDSVIADNQGGSYKKKESAYIIPKKKPAPVSYDNEALDLRERKLSEADDPPPNNGPVIMQPVSEMDNSPPDESDAEIDDINLSMADMGQTDDTDVKKPITTTVVFSASTVATDQNNEEEGIQIPDDPDYDSIRPTSALTSQELHNRPQSITNPTYDDVKDSTPKKTTVVSMRMSELQGDEAEDDPFYSTVTVPAESRPRNNSDSSSDSHAYSNPDLGGYQHNTRDTVRNTIQSNMVIDDEDDYASIGGGDVAQPENEIEDDYYEIGDSNMAQIMKQKSQMKAVEVVDEEKDLGTEKDEQVVPQQTRVVTDIYAVVDKSRKSKAPEFHFSMSRDSCPEEDRELSEMWMEIETIEENLIDTLVNDRVPDGVEEDVENFYFTFVNDTISDISRKNDQLWDREAENIEDYDNVSNWATPYGSEDAKSSEQIEEEYRVAVGKLNKETADSMLKEDKRNNDDAMRLISEHRQTQLELYRCRLAEKKKLNDKLQEMLARRRGNDDADDQTDLPPPPPKFAQDNDSDSDTEELKAQMGQLMNKEAEDSDNEPISQSVDYSSEFQSDSDTDSSSLGQDHLQANMTLKTTLKDDVATNLHRMSVNDFQNLMSLYREERNGLKEMKDAEKSRLDQSLWSKLAERRRNVDQYVHGDDDLDIEGSKAVTVATTTQVNGSSSTVGVQHDHITEQGSVSVGTEVSSSSSAAVGTNVQMVDAGTGMGGTLQFMSQSDSSTGTEAFTSDAKTQAQIQMLDHEFIDRVTKEKQNIDKDAYHNLVKDHLETVTKLRGDKAKAMQLHQEKIKEKLRQRKEKNGDLKKNQSASSSSSSSSDDSDSEFPTRSGSKRKDEDFQKRLDENTDEVMEKLKRADGEMDSDKLAAILAQYHKDQEEILRKRQLECDEMNRKLQEKLDRRKKKQVEGKQTEDEDLGQGDNQFYYDLINRRKNGEISDADIGRLIEEHLGKQEEEVRKQRQEERLRRKEQRRREREANTGMAQDLLDEERQKSRQMKQMRNQEKQKTDQKLQEKLKRRKQEQKYSDTPELPAPRVPPKEKADIEPKSRDGNKLGTYENVNLS